MNLGHEDHRVSLKTLHILCLSEVLLVIQETHLPLSVLYVAFAPEEADGKHWGAQHTPGKPS